MEDFGGGEGVEPVDTSTSLAAVARTPAGGTARTFVYVGEDRRSNPVPGEPFRLGSLAASVAVIALACTLVLWALVVEADLPGGIDADGLTDLLTIATAVLATVAGLLAFVRWRLIGEASSLWVGTGVLLFGIVTMGVADLLPAIYPDAAGASFVVALGPASRILAVTALLIGAIGPAVDTRLRPRIVLGGIVLATAALSATVDAIPQMVETLGSAEGTVAFVLLWAVVALAHLVAARRRGRRHHLAAAVMAFGFALAELATATAISIDVDPGPGPVFLAMLTVALVLIGSTRELEAAFVAQRAEVLDHSVATEVVNAKRRAEHAAHEERVHDARNAILAIDGAAQTLERYRDRLAPDQREALSHAVSEEIQRLQRLIEVDWQEEDCGEFSVAALLAPIATMERARGMRIDVSAPDDLIALGRPADTAEVIRNLLDNARRYAAGSPVEITAEVDSGWVVLRVEDRGRGVARDEREAIFERGRRGRASGATDGSGLGLFVSRRLMREQGGDMWAENRPGGGASFGICLPRIPSIDDGDAGTPPMPETVTRPEVTAGSKEVR